MDTELMQAAEVANAIGLAGVLLYFLSPTIFILLCVYGYKQHKRKQKLTKEKEDNEKKSKSGEINEDAISNIPDEPEDFTKFSSLSLEFDEKGRVKQ